MRPPDVAKDHCEEPPGKPRRKARRGGGEAVDLPLAKEATELFLNALERLELDISRLGLRKERYRDGRFEAEYVHPGAARTFCRDIDANSDEEWKVLCTEHGVDPSQESFIVSGHGFALAEGASQHPAEPLTRLITVYILAGMPLEPLLKKLHPCPGDVDFEQLRQHVEGKKTKQGHVPGLMSEARAVARLVRGGAVRPGPGTGELSPREQSAAW